MQTGLGPNGHTDTGRGDAPLRFDGSVAIVTGAGRGIGRAHALLLAERGAAVVVNDLGVDMHGGASSESPADEVVADIKRRGGTAVASTESIVTAEGAEAIVATALQSFGRIDAVVNNAGILDRALFPDVTLDELNRQLAVHLGGTFNITRAAWPHLRRSTRARVVMTSSPAGLFGGPSETVYGAAKAGLVGLARSMANIGAADDIRVNVIAPGAFSRMTDGIQANPDFKAFTEAHRRADQIAPLVAVLAHQQCPTSGEIFVVSGGMVARAFVAQSRGYVNPDLTPDALLEHWSQVMDEADYFVPRNISECVAIGLDRLRSAGVDVPQLGQEFRAYTR